MSKRFGGNINDMTSMLEGVRSHGLMTGRRDRAEQDRGHAGTRRYALVLATAVLCYAALGTVLGILPDYVHSLGGGAVLVGLAVGAPVLTGAAGRPLGGRMADRHGPPQWSRGPASQSS